MTMKAGRAFLTQAKGWMFTLFLMVLRYYADIPGRLKGSRSRRLTMGNALSGQLRWSMLERNIDLWLKSPMTELIEENGVVVGAVVDLDGTPVRVKEKRGVIIGAAGV